MSKKLVEMDAGMSGLDAFFTPPQKQPAEPTPAEQEPTPAPQIKKSSRKSKLTRKPGIYLSEKVDERLDKEWRKQSKSSRKSKSLIVEEILRTHWGLPPIEEN